MSDKMVAQSTDKEDLLVKKKLASLLIIIPLLTPLASVAETTRYVSDELEITMRTGQGVQFGIRQMLQSGTKVDVIEADPAGYSKVRTDKNITGWVLTRYLSNTPSARNQLESSDQKIATLELELATYKEEIRALSSQNSNTGNENLSLKETSQRLSKELDTLRSTASNAVALDNENRQLKEKLQQIGHDMQSLVIENNALKDSEAKSWFLIGAAVLFCGVIVGLILPRLRIQRKNSWGSLS